MFRSITSAARGLTVHCGVTLLALSTGCSDADSTLWVDSSSESILDGTRVDHANYPAVGVVSTPAGTGTGTLIGSRYVLTAAHVVGEEYKKATPNITVRLGAGSNRRDYSVQYVLIPPSYLQLMNSDQLSKLWKDGIPETRFDIAVLVLNTPVSGITPVQLSAASPTAGTNVSFLGYGRIASGGNLPAPAPNDALYRGTNRVDWLSETYVQTKFTQGTSGVFAGDSGGPLLVGSQLVGVIKSTSGHTYGSINTFTRVSTILPWLNDVLAGGAGLYVTDPYEATESTRPALALNGHYAEPRTFTNSADTDTLRFQLNSTQRVRISIHHHLSWTVPIPTLTVTKDGAPVALSNPDGSVYEGSLAAGTYTITTRNNYARGLSYSLGVSTDGWTLLGDMWEPDDQDVHGQPMGRDNPYNLFPPGDQDMSFFEVTEAGNYRFETLPLNGNPANDRSGDTYLFLYNENFDLIGENDDISSLNSYWSRIEMNLPVGAYLVKVRHYNSAGTIPYYTLRATKY